MRVVALEEHFTAPAVVAKYIKPEMTAKRGHYKGRKVAPGKASPMELLPEFGEKRFKSLDDAGITVQVLSNSGPAPDLVPGADGVAMAREINDHLAGMVAKHPKRFAGFAALWAAFARAAIFPTLASALAGGRNDPRSVQFFDRLEAGITERLSANPEPMQIPLAKIVLTKHRRAK